MKKLVWVTVLSIVFISC
jgi:solute carrier family 30 (zinc transporter), member 2